MFYLDVCCCSNSNASLNWVETQVFYGCYPSKFIEQFQVTKRLTIKAVRRICDISHFPDMKSKIHEEGRYFSN